MRGLYPIVDVDSLTAVAALGTQPPPAPPAPPASLAAAVVAFAERDRTEWLSTTHTRSALLRLTAVVGDRLESNWRHPMFEIIRDDDDRPRFRLLIDDDGPGLPEAARAEMLKRGRRLDETKPGSGLGLSIVSDLAALYRGSLTLEAAPLGGLRAVLELPGDRG